MYRYTNIAYILDKNICEHLHSWKLVALLNRQASHHNRSRWWNVNELSSIWRLLLPGIWGDSKVEFTTVIPIKRE